MEFAIVSLLFFTLVMGCIEWGWFFFVHQRVVNAAREGARAGTLMAPPPSTDPGDAETRAREVAVEYLDRVHLDPDPSAVTAEYELIGAGGGVDAVRVDIAYPFDQLTGFFAGTGLLPTHARATSVMRWQ